MLSSGAVSSLKNLGSFGPEARGKKDTLQAGPRDTCLFVPCLATILNKARERNTENVWPIEHSLVGILRKHFDEKEMASVALTEPSPIACASPVCEIPR